MSRYLTGGMVVLADDHPGTEAALFAGLEYAVRTVVVAHQGLTQLDGAEIVHPKRTVSIDAAFRQAAHEQMPWITMRRDVAGPDSLSQVLEATGRRARKDLPGFAVLFTGPEPRSASRILAVVDRADDHPSGLLTLVAVASAQATGAVLDVLLIGAPGETVRTPKGDGTLQISRDKDLYEQAVRRSQESGLTVNWIVAEDVADKRSLVLEQVAEGDYDLVIEDLSSVRLGGRIGRRGRIRRAVDPDGPAMIVRAVLDDTEVPLVVVLDNVRLGLVPPVVVKGGAGAALALGIMASTAPVASASPSERAKVHETVSQTVESYKDALGQAAAMTAPTTVEAATLAAQQSATEWHQAADQELGAQAGAEIGGGGQPGQVSEDIEAPPADDASDETRDAEEAAAGDAQADERLGGADAAGRPAAPAPDDVRPDKAPKVDPGSVKVSDDVGKGDVSRTQKKSEKARTDLKKTQKAFDSAQEDAVDAIVEAQEAAEDAPLAADELSAAVDTYEQVYAETEATIEAATGSFFGLVGGSAQEEIAAAEQAQGAALTALDEAREHADEALDHYQSAAHEATTANADLQVAAADVTDVRATHAKASARAKATEAAYDESVANTRVSPVPGYAVTTAHGVSGPMWSTGHHTGVDYASPTGTEVVAAASGTVVEVGSSGAYGNRIVVDHGDGYRTTYNHLSAIDVGMGAQVAAGDHLGAVGSTGNSSGAHLHFEVATGGDGWSGGSFVDPETWLAGELG